MPETFSASCVAETATERAQNRWDCLWVVAAIGPAYGVGIIGAAFVTAIVAVGTLVQSGKSAMAMVTCRQKVRAWLAALAAFSSAVTPGPNTLSTFPAFIWI